MSTLLADVRQDRNRLARQPRRLHAGQLNVLVIRERWINDALGVMRSLSVEVAFYLLFPLGALVSRAYSTPLNLRLRRPWRLGRGLR
ncbi:hypothetical protein [Achromobacter dolens]|uniref:hypothetical protein n=1 Tax=Achromobacter dolens TaxID=1287738 RepID=UPI00158380CE|nr:hypothetical protein [Achromobacter dolens]